MDKQKIKVGLLITDFAVPAWLYELLLRITQTNYASLELIIKLNLNDERNTSFFKDFAEKSTHAAYFLYRKLENKYIRVKPDAFVLKDLRALFGNVPEIEFACTRHTNEIYLSAGDIKILQQYHLDVCIKMCSGKLQDEILKSSRYGFWSFNDGNNSFKTNIPAGVWEVIKDLAVTETSLLMWKNNFEQPYLLYKSASATTTNIKKNMNAVYWKSLSFILRKLKEIYEHGDEVFQLKLEQNNMCVNAVESLEAPKNAVFISYLFKRFIYKTKKKLRERYNEQWALIYKFTDENELLNETDNYKTLMPPPDKFWADPCVFSIDENKHCIFFEEYVYKQKKAHISVLSLDKNDNRTEPEIIISKPYHLSYPFVFRDSEDIYMIPESRANRTIELYRCTSFPGKWEFQMNLMENIYAVDTTIYYDGKFWMFVNMKENDGASAWDELFLFYSDTLLTTDWHPHPQNPIVSDVRSARPAGSLFKKEGNLYRPSQDCSVRYGYAININQVLILNEKDYKEQKVTTIYPDAQKEIIATHTFSYYNGLLVLDVKRRIRKK